MVYHGTSTDLKETIQADGLKPLSYFTDDAMLASHYASIRAKQRNSAPMLVCFDVQATDSIMPDENQSGESLAYIVTNPIEPKRITLQEVASW